ncbi:hypothetical protein BN128_1138 [Cronobacter sakazakii 696]|nr:hypothetical protein BN129_1359 [Cronobacter sakazakii 701]CCK07220.1 hypothetical protein BN128_1138 [Cronobacter sakazakii 696]
MLPFYGQNRFMMQKSGVKEKPFALLIHYQNQSFRFNR